MKNKLNDTTENKVYELRVLRKMTQKDLAELVDVSRQTINALEQNKYTPSLLLAFRIANQFGVSINEVFTYKRED
ncbi:helix-turn-helix transcriptional regulator [Bacillus sp. NPDC077411]|uniref:Helix-turn-helix transcriptional regulator n=1 Tax=Bacillus bruguierae TaxID=3127667 RepID=A0ABU8FMU0_9BACI|nr:MULTISPECIES: helix-turn-helix transcriptional regulator [unclassified Bacillus (in: firmicutes)]SFJ98630.1 putative transcriptional regulator [Bacillus sp. 71mf]SFK02969.1 putative transcriptional regulator [Bacillus sp. 71mf]SFS97075.1 putative transcriptional regulator [Bacillus sp. 103mf]SFT23113.1 putative transcriptional regulator [Bacillus sp. 103mf]